MSDQDTQTVDIENFAELVGFPSELIKKELFNNKENDNAITMDELRAAMLKYLDKAMINED